MSAEVALDQVPSPIEFTVHGSLQLHPALGWDVGLSAANQPFGQWESVFPSATMTLAAIDRLVHHAVIFEMNVESYRRRAALNRKADGDTDPATINPAA